MKALDVPKSGKRGNTVAFPSPYGQCERELVNPSNPRTPAQRQWRLKLGDVSAAWAHLTEAQRLAWNAAGLKARRRDRFGNSYSLTGQAHFVAINSARARIGREMLLDPPRPVKFGPSPVGNLIIQTRNRRLTLQLSVGEPLDGDIMVFGAAPCSPGRMKCRNVTYLGLLPAPVRGLSDITRLFRNRFAPPPPGARIFIRTQQQIDGWESGVTDCSAIVPAKTHPRMTRGSC